MAGYLKMKHKLSVGAWYVIITLYEQSLLGPLWSKNKLQ